MNIWRVKSKTGATVHLTSDMEKTFCGRTIGDDWQFLFLLNDRTEALEHVDGLCGKCNATNLEEWEKEFVDDDGSDESGDESDSNEVVEEDTGIEDGKDEVKPVRADRPKGLGTW